MVICPRCQAQNPDGMVQCGRCGYPLLQRQMPQYASNQPVPANIYDYNRNEETPPFQNSFSKTPSKTKSKKKNDSSKIILLVICILLLISNLAVIWIYVQARKDNQKQKELYTELQKTAFSNMVSEQISSLTEPTSISAATNRPGDRVALAPTLTPTPNVEAQSVHIGDKISLDFVEFSLDSIEWTKRIDPSDTSGYFTEYFSAKDDEQFLVLWGTMKNLSGESIRFDQMKVQFEFNEKYKFSGQVEMEDDDKGGFNSVYSIKPLKQSRFIIFASVPNEVISLYDHGTLTFGFDDFQHYVSSTKMDELEHLYRLDFSK